jgi:hypothetical protein
MAQFVGRAAEGGAAHQAVRGWLALPPGVPVPLLDQRDEAGLEADQPGVAARDGQARDPVQVRVVAAGERHLGPPAPVVPQHVSHRVLRPGPGRAADGPHIINRVAGHFLQPAMPADAGQRLLRPPLPVPLQHDRHAGGVRLLRGVVLHAHGERVGGVDRRHIVQHAGRRPQGRHIDQVPHRRDRHRRRRRRRGCRGRGHGQPGCRRPARGRRPPERGHLPAAHPLADAPGQRGNRHHTGGHRLAQPHPAPASQHGHPRPLAQENKSPTPPPMPSNHPTRSPDRSTFISSRRVPLPRSEMSYGTGQRPPASRRSVPAEAPGR